MKANMSADTLCSDHVGQQRPDKQNAMPGGGHHLCHGHVHPSLFRLPGQLSAFLSESLHLHLHLVI